jgi:hypothetical protein
LFIRLVTVCKPREMPALDPWSFSKEKLASMKWEMNGGLA